MGNAPMFPNYPVFSPYMLGCVGGRMWTNVKKKPSCFRNSIIIGGFSYSVVWLIRAMQ